MLQPYTQRAPIFNTHLKPTGASSVERDPSGSSDARSRLLRKPLAGGSVFLVYAKGFFSPSHPFAGQCVVSSFAVSECRTSVCVIGRVEDSGHQSRDPVRIINPAQQRRNRLLKRGARAAQHSGRHANRLQHHLVRVCVVSVRVYAWQPHSNRGDETQRLGLLRVWPGARLL